MRNDELHRKDYRRSETSDRDQTDIEFDGIKLDGERDQEQP